ncbi:MAG: hypothetical protein RBR09_00635 [Desulfobulbaceae bacterium]|nr:hypothetical protein [Desulfobulbaceae bacterium]MDY0349737.1 hypothetical protein [Desulfobulbaceae bacterium]
MAALKGRDTACFSLEAKRGTMRRKTIAAPHPPQPAACTNFRRGPETETAHR